MKRKHKRLTFIVIALCLFSTAAGLILMALEDNIIFFYSPTDLIEKNPDPKQRLRLGGLVAEKSLKKLGDAMITFEVKDAVKTVRVRYKGILPDLFREGQGVVTQGRFVSGIFEAKPPWYPFEFTTSVIYIMRIYFIFFFKKENKKNKRK